MKGQRYIWNGKKWIPAEQAAQERKQIIGCGKGWPLRLLSLKGHPKQAKQLRERAKLHGISVEYDNTGAPIVPDLGNYKKLMRLEGVHQQNSFTGS